MALVVLLGVTRAEAQVIYDVQTPVVYKATVCALWLSSGPKFYNIQIKQSSVATWKNLEYTKQQVVAGSGTLTFSVDSLLSGTNYDVRIKSEDTSGTILYSTSYSFTSRYAEINPVVVTLPVTNRKRTGVWLRGNWSMGQGKGYFMYRFNNTGSWMQTPKMDFYGLAKDSVYFITALPGTSIAYKAIGENSMNIVDGGIQNTSTLPATSPSVVSVVVQSTTATTATVRLVFNANASNTRVKIESRGPSSMYVVKNDTTILFGGEKDTMVTYVVTGYNPNTLYENKVTLINGIGSVTSVFTFTTNVLPDSPNVMLFTPEQTQAAIVFKGAVNPNGTVTHVKFCYWEETGSPGTPICTEEIVLSGGFDFINISIPVPLSQFVYNKIYFVSLRATNEGGTTNSLINAQFTPSFTLGMDDEIQNIDWSNTHAVVTDMQGRIVQEEMVTDLTFVPKGVPSGMYVTTFIKEGVKTVKKKTIVQ